MKIYDGPDIWHFLNLMFSLSSQIFSQIIDKTSILLVSGPSLFKIVLDIFTFHESENMNLFLSVPISERILHSRICNLSAEFYSAKMQCNYS